MAGYSGGFRDKIENGGFSGAVSAIEDRYRRKIYPRKILFRENFERIIAAVTSAALVFDEFGFIGSGSKFKGINI